MTSRPDAPNRAAARNTAKIGYSGTVAVITLDGPPLNVLDLPLRKALQASLAEVLAKRHVSGLILRGAGGCFANAPDLRDESSLSDAPSLADLTKQLEQAKIPTVALLTGRSLGAGAALALGAHYRVAEAGAHLGWPEIRLGQIAGGGTTQRLPRLAGFKEACDILLQPRVLSAQEAFELTLVDVIAPQGGSLEAAIALIQTRVDPRPVGHLPVRQPPLARRALEELRALHPSVPFDSPANTAGRILECVEASLGALQQGLALEERLAMQARKGVVAKGLRAAAIEAHMVATRGPQGRPIKGATFIAGDGPFMRQTALTVLERMQSEPALCCVGTDMDEAETVRAEIEGALAHLPQMTPHMRKGLRSRINLYSATNFIGNIARAEIFVWQPITPEATALRTGLDAMEGTGVLLTSHMDFAAGHETQRLGGVGGQGLVGLVAQYGRLWELRADPATLSTDQRGRVTHWVRTLGGLPLWGRMGDGSIAHRLMGAFWLAADHLVARGALPQEVDLALEKYGFIQGPFAQRDTLGLNDLPLVEVPQTPCSVLSEPHRLSRIFAAGGRTGRAQGAGFYDYDTAKSRLSSAPEALELLRSLRDDTPMDEAEIVEYVVTALQNTAASLLGLPGMDLAMDGRLDVAAIDQAAIQCTGFPRWRGGPLDALDREGAGVVLSRIWRNSALDPLFWRAAKPLEAAVGQLAMLRELNLG